MANGYELTIDLDQVAIRNLTRSRELIPGMTVATHFVERESKQRAPVRTGNLRRSLYSEVEVDGLSVVGRVGTNVDYGIHQELGTRFHPPQPYLRPAVEALRTMLRRGRL